MTQYVNSIVYRGIIKEFVVATSFLEVIKEYEDMGDDDQIDITHFINESIPEEVIDEARNVLKVLNDVKIREIASLEELCIKLCTISPSVRHNPVLNWIGYMCSPFILLLIDTVNCYLPRHIPDYKVLPGRIPCPHWTEYDYDRVRDNVFVSLDVKKHISKIINENIERYAEETMLNMENAIYQGDFEMFFDIYNYICSEELNKYITNFIYRITTLIDIILKDGIEKKMLLRMYFYGLIEVKHQVIQGREWVVRTIDAYFHDTSKEKFFPIDPGMHGLRNIESLIVSAQKSLDKEIQNPCPSVDVDGLHSLIKWLHSEQCRVARESKEMRKKMRLEDDLDKEEEEEEDYLEYIEQRAGIREDKYDIEYDQSDTEEDSDFIYF